MQSKPINQRSFEYLQISNHLLIHPASFRKRAMSVEKCVVRAKTLRLFIVFGAFSTIVIVLIYSLPNNDKNITTNFNQGLFSTWPIKSSSTLHVKTNKKTANPIENGEKQPLKALGSARSGRSNSMQKNHYVRNKIKYLTSNNQQNDDLLLFLNSTKRNQTHSVPNIHIFYTIPVDWDTQSTAFYPLLDLYVPDNKTLQHHFKTIQLLGANVLIVTLSPQTSNQLLCRLFDEAQNFGIRIAFEIDNYPNRTVFSIYNDIHYVYNEFAQHQSLYKVFVTSKGNFMPMFYMKNIDNIAKDDWKKLLSPNAEISLRNGLHDAIFIGHIR